MTRTQPSDGHSDDSESRQEGPEVQPIFLEPRCRICRNDDVRVKVNDLLARGATYASVLRALTSENSRLDERERVTVDSVRNHAARHFPVQDAARATYREVLERRALENGADFVHGVANALTPLAFLETVMLKGYQTMMIDSDGPVSFSAAMSAAMRLQEVVESQSGETDIADVMVKFDRLVNAVKATVPEELWPEILAKINDEAIEPTFGTEDIDEDSECDF